MKRTQTTINHAVRPPDSPALRGNDCQTQCFNVGIEIESTHLLGLLAMHSIEHDVLTAHSGSFKRWW